MALEQKFRSFLSYYYFFFFAISYFCLFGSQASLPPAPQKWKDRPGSAATGKSIDPTSTEQMHPLYLYLVLWKEKVFFFFALSLSFLFRHLFFGGKKRNNDDSPVSRPDSSRNFDSFFALPTRSLWPEQVVERVGSGRKYPRLFQLEPPCSWHGKLTWPTNHLSVGIKRSYSPSFRRILAIDWCCFFWFCLLFGQLLKREWP